MLNLEPLIARFVDDVLRAVRRTNLNELRDLLVTAPAAAPGAPRRRAAAPGKAPAGLRTAKPMAPAPAGDALALKPRPARTETPADHVPTSEPLEIAEITDPERLLADAAPSGALAPYLAAEGEPEEEPPPSTERLAARPTVALREGESLARDAGAGIVIRRRKRA
jgi:hypothetical protein